VKPRYCPATICLAALWCPVLRPKKSDRTTMSSTLVTANNPAASATMLAFTRGLRAWSR
jgi:hypothetical protein